MEKPILPKKEMWAYALGLFGLQAVIGFMNSYQAQFYSRTMAADLAIVGVIMLIAKLFSAFFDPFIGSIIDKSNFKSGKLKPFVLFAVGPFLLLSVLIFIALPLRGVALYIYIFISFTLWSISMSLADIPSQGMLALLTPDPTERNKAAGLGNFAKQVGLAICMGIVPLVCILTKSEGGAITQKEYLISAIVLAVLGGALFLFIFFFNKERVPYSGKTTTIKGMVKELKGNKPLLLVLLSNLLGFSRNMAMNMQAQAASVLVGSVELFGMTFSGENTILIMTVGSVIASIIALSLTPVLARKIGEKKTFIIVAVYGFVASIVGFVLFMVGLRSLIAIIIFRFLAGLMVGTYGFIPMVMVSDCVDHHEWKTGKRNEGAQFSMLSMSVKISNAFSVALALLILGAANYSATATSYSERTTVLTYFAYMLVPGIGSILSIIPILFYKISGKNKEELHRALSERRALEAEITTEVLDENGAN